MPVELTSSSQIRKTKALQKVPKPIRPTESILFRAPLTGYTGYGLHASQIVTDLQKMGYQFDIRAIVIEETFAPIPDNVRHCIVCQEPQATWELLLHPPGAAPSAGRKTVYFTMWESTRLHPTAVNALNQAEHVIVPSQWNASCFSASGVERPIRVIPLGINTEVFHFRPMKMDGPCIFGTAGRFESGGTRKGINRVIKLFQKTFPTERDVRLRVKVFPDCQVAHVSDPRIEIQHEYLTEAELADWFSEITCFVSAAKGEGWGLMQHQALAMGRPLISVRYGGVAEFFTEDMGYPVDFKLVPGEAFYSGCGLWAEPDDNHMAELMKRVYKSRDDSRERGITAAEIVGKYSWKRSNGELVKVLRDIGMLR
jgi:glycosyltransferase involved in cell wall biosynthesis